MTYPESKNLFDLPDPMPDVEFVEALVPGREVRIERIVSMGHTTPEGVWYDQEQDEWVALVQGEARLEFAEGPMLGLTAGEHVLIPAHKKHRVSWTSSDPPCVWIAVHGRLK